MNARLMFWPGVLIASDVAHRHDEHVFRSVGCIVWLLVAMYMPPGDGCVLRLPRLGLRYIRGEVLLSFRCSKPCVSRVWRFANGD
jgi:hypothetical protein